MTFSNPHDEFAVRYYLWAKEEFKLEIERDFPLLRRIPDISAKTCLKLMDGMSMSEKHFFGATMVKRFHRGATLSGESLNPEEHELEKMYRSALLAYAREDHWRRQGKERPLVVGRQKLAAKLKTVLRPIFDFEEPAVKGAPVWFYSNEICGFNVRTCIDLPGREHSIGYTHSIGTSPRDILCECISVLSWLGLLGQTAFDPITEPELEATARLVMELSQHFLAAAPKLLKGIQVKEKVDSRR